MAGLADPAGSVLELVRTRPGNTPHQARTTATPASAAPTQDLIASRPFQRLLDGLPEYATSMKRLVQRILVGATPEELLGAGSTRSPESAIAGQHVKLLDERIESGGIGRELQRRHLLRDRPPHHQPCQPLLRRTIEGSEALGKLRAMHL
jgi:hypothetical protein